MKRSFLILCIIILISGSAICAEALDAKIDAPKLSLDQPDLAPQIQSIPSPQLFVRIVFDSLYCKKESEVDGLSSEDEPYLMTTAFASHRDPNAWSLGESEIFSGVDSNNNRRFKKPNRVIYEGTVPKDAAIGFHTVLWERDASPQDTRRNIAQALCRRINDNFTEVIDAGNNTAGWIGGFVGSLYGLLPSIYVAIGEQLGAAMGGGGDDKVGDVIVGYDYDELLRMSQAHKHITRREIINGGDEGVYWLRYHIEFMEKSTADFDAKFTEWDDMAVGNTDRIHGDEIVMVSDEDGPDNNGRFYIYSSDGKQIRSFDQPYAAYDRIALADTTGNGVCEIVTASIYGGGLVRTYNSDGKLMNRMNIPFAKYDGFAAADVDGCGKAEIIIAKVSDRKIYIYSSADGKKINDFGLNWQFKGTRYNSRNTRHDALLVGDVLSDKKADIVMIENKNGMDSKIYVYDQKGSEMKKSEVTGKYGAAFTTDDGAALGDIYGDDKKELILAISDDSGSDTYTMTVIDLAADKRAGNRYYAWYEKYSGFASGAVFGPGKAQIVVFNRADSKAYIGR